MSVCHACCWCFRKLSCFYYYCWYVCTMYTKCCNMQVSIPKEILKNKFGKDAPDFKNGRTNWGNWFNKEHCWFWKILWELLLWFRFSPYSVIRPNLLLKRGGNSCRCLYCDRGSIVLFTEVILYLSWFVACITLMFSVYLLYKFYMYFM